MQLFMLILPFVLAASDKLPYFATSPLKCPISSVPGGIHDVRVYTTDIAVVEEGDYFTSEEKSDEIEPSPTVDVESLCLEHNSHIVDVKAKSFKISQSHTNKRGECVYLIESPTTSHISHKLLHPSLYRNIKDVGSLHAFAEMINAPKIWEEIYEIKVARDKALTKRFLAFQALAKNTQETYIQGRLTDIIISVGDCLGFPVHTCLDRNIIVGGILARDQYDIRGLADPYYENFDGDHVLATETKTEESFGERHMWYHKSRATQIFSSLFALHCPTFLVTPKQWKLFVETPDRNSILTFPYNKNPSYAPHLASTLVHPMGNTFLKALTICIMAKPAFQSVESDSKTAVDLPQDSQDMKTVGKRSQDSEKKILKFSGDPTEKCPRS
jgi:hypothetical protein